MPTFGVKRFDFRSQLTHIWRRDDATCAAATPSLQLRRPADPLGATITNPTVIVEVLSPSTEQEDRGNEWQHYQLIPALQEYVLLSQVEARVERYRRLPSGAWEYSDTTQGSVQLLTGALLDLSKLYTGLPD